MTVGMEKYQIFPSIILVVAIPVMQFEVFLALDAPVDRWDSVLSAAAGVLHETPRSLCSASVDHGVGSTPPMCGSNGLASALDLDMALGFDRLLHTDELCAGRRIGKPPGCARLMGKITVGDPTAGFIRVPQLGPSIESSPDKTVECAQRSRTQMMCRW